MDAWIVTGGAGFIGSNFVRLALRETDVRIVVVDKLTYAGNLLSLDDVAGHDRFHFVKGDVSDRDAVGALYREFQPSAVLNFAAETHVDRSIDGPAAFIHTNVVGTFELLEAARHHLAGCDASANFLSSAAETELIFIFLANCGRPRSEASTIREMPRPESTAARAA